MSAPRTLLDIFTAREIARQYLARQIQLVPCRRPEPGAIYAFFELFFEGENEHNTSWFRVEPREMTCDQPITYVAVDRRTGNVRSIQESCE